MSHRLLFVAICLVCFGCESPSVQPVDGTVFVEGTVTFDGDPLSDGRISFIDSEGTPPREYMAAVQNGEFRLQIPPQVRRVEIRAAEQTTSTDAVGKFKQPIPARYNDKSELTVDLRSEGPIKLTFDLTSRGT